VHIDVIQEAADLSLGVGIISVLARIQSKLLFTGHTDHRREFIRRGV